MQWNIGSPWCPVAFPITLALLLISLVGIVFLFWRWRVMTRMYYIAMSLDTGCSSMKEIEEVDRKKKKLIVMMLDITRESSSSHPLVCRSEYEVALLETDNELKRIYYHIQNVSDRLIKGRSGKAIRRTCSRCKESFTGYIYLEGDKYVHRKCLKYTHKQIVFISYSVRK